MHSLVIWEFKNVTYVNKNQTPDVKNQTHLKSFYKIQFFIDTSQGGGGVSLSHFSERLYRRELVQIGFWVGIGTLGGGDFFQVRSENSQILCDCNFYNFSLLVLYPNKFLVVCICILIFHSAYSPIPTNIFFVGN